MSEKRRIYFYSGTHWDREWYQTFQGFRKRLVDAIDGLIASAYASEYIFKPITDHLNAQTMTEL